MAYLHRLPEQRTKQQNRLFVFICLQLLFIAGCADHESAPREFRYFKLDGLNRFLQPAANNPDQVYVYHALTKDGNLAPPQECGLGSLEDAALAVQVYLRHAEITGDTTNLKTARALLTSILRWQRPDGLFSNWINAEGHAVRCASAGWTGFGNPEVRGMWALAAGAAFFRNRHRAFAVELRDAFWRSFGHVDTCLAKDGQFSQEDDLQIPQWLPYGSGAGAASELVVACMTMLRSELFAASPTQRLEQAIMRLAVGILCMQTGDAKAFPFGAHLAYQSYWYSRGNCAMQALTLAGARFNQKEWLQSAQLAADYFVPYLQKIKFARRFNLIEARQNNNRIEYFPQAAADMRPLITGLIELAAVTGNQRYARRAGEIARWFRGENMAHEPIYLAETGLAKNHIQSRNYVEPTLTASATIEALIALLEVETNRHSRKIFYADVENVLTGKP